MHWGCYYAAALDIEVDPQRRRFGCLGENVVCVFITAVPITKLFAWGGGGDWRTCATRDDEPRPVRFGLPVGLQKKKTQKLAVHAVGCAHDSGEKRNVLIVSVLLPIAVNFTLRSKTQRCIEVLGMR